MSVTALRRELSSHHTCNKISQPYCSLHHHIEESATQLSGYIAKRQHVQLPGSFLALDLTKSNMPEGP